MYNEMVILKLVQSMTKLITSPPEVFKDQIHEHFRQKGENFYQRIKSWMQLSETDANRSDKVTEGGLGDFSMQFRNISLKSFLSTRNRPATRLSSDPRFERLLFDSRELPRSVPQEDEGHQARRLSDATH